jgi:hypothetical protein
MKSLDEEILNCPICFAMIEDPITTFCGHNFCHKCFIQTKERCPVCRKQLGLKDFTPNYQLKTVLLKIKQIQQKQNKYRIFTPVMKNITNNIDENLIKLKEDPMVRKKRKHSEINSAPIQQKTTQLSKINGVKLDYNNSDLEKAIQFFSEMKDVDIFSITVNSVQDKIVDDITEYRHKRFKFN